MQFEKVQIAGRDLVSAGIAICVDSMGHMVTIDGISRTIRQDRKGGQKIRQRRRIPADRFRIEIAQQLFPAFGPRSLAKSVWMSNPTAPSVRQNSSIRRREQSRRKS